MIDRVGIRGFIAFTDFESNRKILVNREFIESVEFGHNYTYINIKGNVPPLKVKESKDFIMSFMKYAIADVPKWDMSVYFMAGVGFVLLMQHLFDWASK